MSVAIYKPQYSASSLVSLTPNQRETVIAGLSQRQQLELLYDWKFWARPEQLPPPGPWLCWLLRSGRGAGKTRTGAEYVIERARTGYKRIALIGQTKADVRDTMIEIGESSILQVSPPWFMPAYEPSKRRLVWPNGCIGTAFSGDEPSQLRGPQHDTVWIDELFKFKYPQLTWDEMEFGLRAGPDPRVVVTATPRPLTLAKALAADPDTVDVRTSTYRNIANLAPAFIARMLKRYEGTRLGRQELHGEILDDNPRALWQRAAMIDAHRVTSHPDLVRIVVGVDPPATSTGAECGIVVSAKGIDGHLYVLDDCSLQGSPATWAGAAVTAYHKWGADRIIGEVNNGGDMIERVIRTVDGGKDVAYTAVRASRGKQTRAEPISSLYESTPTKAGKGHHVGTFADLEDQMCQWVPGEGASPDRLDALVWGGTELFGESLEEPAGEIVEDAYQIGTRGGIVREERQRIWAARRSS